MKKVDMFELGEDVLIKAKITDIIVENGELKYKIKTEHSNNDLDHKFTEHQIIPVFKKIEEDEENPFEEDEKTES